MRAVFLILLVLAACVKGNPIEDSGEFVGNGGSFAIADCGYTVTTRDGAEAPKLGTAAVGIDPTPRFVHLGIVGDPKTSIVAQWRTKDETTRATTIRYAQGANLAASQLTETKTGIEFGYKATGTDVFRVHQAHLCGLTPGTTYSYQVGAVDASGTSHFSPIYTFHTAPDVVAHPDAEVVFAFVGDSRGGYDVWQQLVDQIQQRSPDLVLFSGDAVTIGITQYEWDEFFGRAESLFATTPDDRRARKPRGQRGQLLLSDRAARVIRRTSVSTTASRTSPSATTPPMTWRSSRASSATSSKPTSRRVTPRGGSCSCITSRCTPHRRVTVRA